MRKQAKLLANFLGATKELTNEYVGLAEITDNELDQISFTVMKREDRKTTAKMLAAKGLSTREIAQITGWSQSAIVSDLRTEQNRSQSEQKRSPPANSTTTHAAKEEHAAEVAAAAEAEGVTSEPAKKYRIIYADPPWSYGNTMPDGTTEPRS